MNTNEMPGLDLLLWQQEPLIPFGHHTVRIQIMHIYSKLNVYVYLSSINFWPVNQGFICNTFI